MTMNTELTNQDEQFATELAEEVIGGGSLCRFGLLPSENALVISALRENLDIQFALRLTEAGSNAEDVEDIGNQRHYMSVALEILDIED